MSGLHETAVIDPSAKLGQGVSIGPYCVVGPDVELGDDVQVAGHVVIDGHTRIGARCRISPFASIGGPPQDLKYAGEPSQLIVGEDNIIREYVTMNPGTKGGGMVTRVGSGCLFMMSSHVAHDCTIGDHVILANNATLAGHVEVGDQAIIGGLSAVHQFVRIGAHAMVGGMSGVEHDVVPFGLVAGERARLSGVNIIGMKRRGFSRDDIQSLRGAFQNLFSNNATLAERLDQLERDYGGEGPVGELVAFLRADASRALCRPKAGDDAAA